MKRPKFLLELSTQQVQEIESAIAKRCTFWAAKGKDWMEIRWSADGTKDGKHIGYTSLWHSKHRARLSTYAAQLNAWTQALAEARTERLAAEHYNPSNCR